MPSSSPPVPLRKFTLHPTALAAPSSPLVLAGVSSEPFTLQSLNLVRSTLLHARTSATERLVIRDSNRRNLSERQAALNRTLEETSRIKEQDRKRKREEEDLRDKDRRERSTSRALEAARLGETDAAGTEKSKLSDELALKRVKEKGRVVKVLELVGVNERERSTASPPNGHSLQLAPHEPTLPSTASPWLNGSSAAPIPLAATIPLPVPPLARVTSSDVEDESGQPSVRRKMTQDKKRKRENVIADSDDDSDSESLTLEDPLKKIRRLDSDVPSDVALLSEDRPAAPERTETISLTLTLTPPVPVDPFKGLSHLRRKLKEDKFSKHAIPIRAPAAGAATAFYLPTQSLVPPLPISVPPPATAKRQSEVSEDFSKAKPGTQITFHTFHTWAESFLRPFGEDDLAFLAPRPDDIAPYVMPACGKPYLDQWDDEDQHQDSAPHASTSYLSPLEPPPPLRVRAEHLTEDSLGMENVYGGPLTERLIAALAFEHESAGMDFDMSEKRESLHGGVAIRSMSKMGIDAVELEERIKKELRFIGILGEEDVDWGRREDDEISSSLRACQRLLHRQNMLNEARKVILTCIVKDRMGYQEYEATRDAQERVIENGWHKRQRTGSKKKGKARDKERERDKAVVELANGAKPPVSLTLLSALQTRDKLVGHFKPFFDDDEERGRFYGIPQESIFKDIHIEDDEDEIM